MAPPLLPISTSDSDTDQANVPTSAGRRIPWRPLSLVLLGSVLLAGVCFAGLGGSRSQVGAASEEAQALPAGQEQDDTLADILSMSDEDEDEDELNLSEDLQQKWMHGMFHGHPFHGLGPQMGEAFGPGFPHPGGQPGPHPDHPPVGPPGPWHPHPPGGPAHQLPLPGRPYFPPGKGHKCLWRVFHELDTDHDNVLEEPSELRNLSVQFRQRFNLTAGQYQRMYDGAGKTESGKIDFKSLKQFAGVLHIFRFADKNKDGAIAGQELSLEGFALAKELKSLHLPEGTLQELLEDANTDDYEGLSPAEVKGLLVKVDEYFLPQPFLGFFRRLDADMDDVLEDEELPEMNKLLENRLSIATSFQDKFLQQHGGKDKKLDRRGFKELIWTAWAGPPFAAAGPLKMVIFFRHADKDRSLYVEEHEMPFVRQALQKFTKLDDAQLQELAKKSDENSDNKLRPAEFAHFVQAAKPVMSKPGWSWPPMHPKWQGEHEHEKGEHKWHMPGMDKEKEHKWEKGVGKWEDRMDKWQKRVEKELKEGHGDGSGEKGVGEWEKAVDKWQKKVHEELEDKMHKDGENKWPLRAGLRAGLWPHGGGEPWQKPITVGGKWHKGHGKEKQKEQAQDEDKRQAELVPVVQRPNPLGDPRLQHAKQTNLFRSLDRDQDHYIDGPELEVMSRRFSTAFGLRDQLYSKLFAAADLDADGKLSAPEFEQFFTAMQAVAAINKQSQGGAAQVSAIAKPTISPAAASAAAAAKGW